MVTPSTKYDASVIREQYRVDKIGWHPGCGAPRQKRPSISKAKRRAVFERDGWMCQVCGARSGEPMVEDVDKSVVLTVCQVLSDDYGGSVDIAICAANVRTASNQSVPRQRNPSRPKRLRRLPEFYQGDRVRMVQRIEARRQLRGPAEEVYDRYRRLATGDHETARLSIKKLAGLGDS